MAAGSGELAASRDGYVVVAGGGLVVVGAVVVGAGGMAVVTAGGGGTVVRVLVRGRGRVVVRTTGGGVDGGCAAGTGGAGSGWGGATSQDGTGNGTRLVSGKEVWMSAGITGSSQPALPSNRATDATPPAMRTTLLCTGAAPFLDDDETLRDRADAIRYHSNEWNGPC